MYVNLYLVGLFIDSGPSAKILVQSICILHIVLYECKYA